MADRNIIRYSEHGKCELRNTGCPTYLNESAGKEHRQCDIAIRGRCNDV